MARLSNKSGASQRPTVADLIEGAERRLRRARVFFGHGTDNARDEAAALVLYGLKIPHRSAAKLLARRPAAADRARVAVLLERRITERLPLAYLTHEAWFAGLKFFVDERVLVPRSPLAELIERSFSPWIDQRRVRRIL